MRIRSQRVLSLFFLIFFTNPYHVCAQSVATSDKIPSAHFSFGEKLSVNGLPNAGKIDNVLFRGAQPHSDGLPALKKMGVTTIVDLREEHPEKITWERKQAEALGIRFVSIPVNGWAPPTHEQVAQFLTLVRDHPGEKIFVHCRFGNDRTGVFVAAYRIARNGWTAEQAVSEMYYFGFKGAWHRNMKSYVLNFPASLQSAPALTSFQLPPTATGKR